MIEVNRMRLGLFEFIVDFGSFRRITACWSGPGWDISFRGLCINDDPQKPTFPEGWIGVYYDAAPLPFAKAADYTGIEFSLPGYYEESSGEPYFAVSVVESYEVSDAYLRFAARDHGRYLIQLSGTVSAGLLGYSERFQLSGWADELPDHSHLDNPDSDQGATTDGEGM